MTKRRLTDRTIKSLKPASAEAAPIDIMDAIVPGFGVRVMGTRQHPVRTYILRVRFPGSNNPTRARLGSYDETDKLSLEAAREKARDWLSMIRKGRDPRLEEARAREAEIRRQAVVFGAVAEDFFENKLSGERRGSEVKREIKKAFEGWWERPISEITDEDIIRTVRAKARTAPSAARNLLGSVKRLFQWAIDQRTYNLKNSPASDIKPVAIVGEKIARDHLLSDDELRAFWRAASRKRGPAGAAYRMLALTGLRLNEVARASWSEFHPTVVRALRQRTGPIDWSKFDREHLVWVIPAARMKGKNSKAKPHAVPLTPDMLHILESLPLFAGADFLFSYTGRVPAAMSAEVKDAIDKRMARTLKALARQRGDDPVELQPWRNHDIRRTVRTSLSSLKIPDEVAEAVMGHARPGIKAVYDLHHYLPEKRDALERWGSKLRSIVEPAPTESNVVKLRG